LLRNERCKKRKNRVINVTDNIDKSVSKDDSHMFKSLTAAKQYESIKTLKLSQVKEDEAFKEDDDDTDVKYNRNPRVANSFLGIIT